MKRKSKGQGKVSRKKENDRSAKEAMSTPVAAFEIQGAYLFYKLS
jgi:hypothetical protein